MKNTALLFLIGILLISCQRVHQSSGWDTKNIQIARDEFGVPHIFGKTDADAAYGLAWAHSEDDFETIQKTVLAGKGLAGRVFGEEINQIAEQLQSYLSRIPTQRFERVPCHNDPSPENFFHQDGRLYLHDWELAGLNDPMWDLAHLSVIGQVEPDDLLHFYPTLDPLANQKIRFFQGFVFFNTILWAALEIAHPVSNLPIETVRVVYQNFLDRINLLIKSELFQSSIQQLIED
jgi:hypothetical protein